MTAISAGAILPVMLAVPCPPRDMTGMISPKFGESQHIREMSFPAATILAICLGLAMASLSTTILG